MLLPKRIGVGWDLTTAYDLHQVLAQLKSLELGYKKREKWYFVTKIILTYCEKKLL